jgi:hypothetical protein
MNPHDTRHKEKSKYAHYSRINKKNYKNYNLKNTNPIKIILKKGECLYIPKGYWHWIVSHPNTKAYNIWFNDCNLNFSNPYILEEKLNCIINNEFLIKLLGNNNITIFDDNINNDYNMTITEFINKKIENTYIITLQDIYSKNRFIIDLLEKYLPIPKILNNVDIHKENINFWFNIGGMDTGMHYDDDDGILCVIEGIKEILLFPPKDSLLLDGYKYQVPWINNKIENLLFNTYTIKQNQELNNKIHNNALLLFSLQNMEMIRYINNLCGIFGENNLIYGIKCDLKGQIRHEIYFYTYSKYDKSYLNNHSIENVKRELSTELFYPLKNINHRNINNKNLIIHSFDLYNIDNKITFNKPNEKIKISLYYNLHIDNLIDKPLYGKLIDYDGENLEELLFIVAETPFIINNITHILEKLKLKINPLLIINLIQIYNYVPEISIFNKGIVNNNQSFCIIYFGLHEEDFYNFLVKYNYPKVLTSFYYKNHTKLNYINKEVTIYFEIVNDKVNILRTSFYGSL